MLFLLIGTRAQLIKMAPVMRELEQAGRAYRLVMTGQHHVTMRQLLDEFEIRTRAEWLREGQEVDSISAVPRWILAAWRGLKQLPESPREGDTVVVHGDTFSTLLGAVFAWRRGCRLAHVESGLTSKQLFDPFPEELVRRIVFRFANVAFCPGREAALHMQARPLTVVDTGENTLLDAVRMVLRDREQMASGASTADVVVSIHRFENLYSNRLATIVSFANELSKSASLLVVLHPATRKRLEATGLLRSLEREPGVTLVPRMGYLEFLAKAAGAKLVITDGGSNQEELSYLGVPTLLMRQATERPEGLGRNAMLGGTDFAAMRAFAEAALNASPPRSFQLPDAQPSREIANWLEKHAAD